MGAGSRASTSRSSAVAVADPYLSGEGGEDPDRDDQDPSSSGRPDNPRVFKEVLALISDLCPAARSSSLSTKDSFPWFDDFGNPLRKEPLIFLSLSDKLAPLQREVEEQFAKAADDKKKAVSALRKWGDIYHLGDQDDFHRARKLNEKFSRLLDKQVLSSCYLVMTLDETTKLETCICGQLGSQSFSLWAIAAIFASLKDWLRSPG